jgi:hypothetical protein
VSKAASLALILECYRNGLILVDTKIWRKPNRVGDELANLIEQRTTRIDLPTTPRIVLFRWEQAQAGAPERCADLPILADSSGG